MSLIQTVIDAVFEEVPVNLHCSLCDREQDISTVLDTSSDKKQWERMAEKVIGAVLFSVGNAVSNIEVKDLD